MPINSLKNISVPVNDGQKNGTLLMPKLQYRFRTVVSNFGNSTDLTEITKQTVDVTRPNLTFENITIDAYNSRSYIAGKHTWEPVTLTLREDVNNRVQRLVGEQLQKQFDFYEQASAFSGGSYKFGMAVEVLDGGNGNFDTNVVDRINLVGCYIESANYNSLSYATNDPVTITLSIRYDNAIQTEEDGVTRTAGLGISVGRSTANTTINTSEGPTPE